MKPNNLPEHLPEHLPGINLQKGIKHWEDDWEDYFYVLNMFADRRCAAADDIAEFLQAGSRNKAVELAHAVKGASGNLLLTPTFECARDLEMTLRDENADAGEALNHFRKALAEAFNSIQQLSKIEAPDADDEFPLDRARMKILILGLSDAFNEGVLDETFSNMLREIITSLRGHANEQAKILKRQSAEFEFDDALGTLKEISNKLGIEVED